VLENPQWPEEFPFRDEMFNCFDEASDEAFYAAPRFVEHIDKNAIRSIKKHYEATFPSTAEARANASVLDMCSSWISHYPEGFSAGRVAGLGMNGAELAKNPMLTEYAVKDLNVSPELPYGDNEFDVVTNAVSVDYLRKPLEIFRCALWMESCCTSAVTAVWKRWWQAAFSSSAAGCTELTVPAAFLEGAASQHSAYFHCVQKCVFFIFFSRK
jgi:hypothetical protein